MQVQSIAGAAPWERAGGRGFSGAGWELRNARTPARRR
jgi:hypothetical protein